MLSEMSRRNAERGRKQMSGGSLGYLYCKTEADEIMRHTDEMERAEAELIKRGYIDIAEDVRRLIEYCKTAQIRIEVLHQNLSDVFHAIEWRISNDYGEDSLIEHLNQYREGKEN